MHKIDGKYNKSRFLNWLLNTHITKIALENLKQYNFQSMPGVKIGIQLHNERSNLFLIYLRSVLNVV